jgi:hypothetical protein
MSKRFLTPLGLLSATSDPVSASIGDVYFNSSSNVTRVYYGSAWVNLSASSTLAIHANTASSIAGSLVSGTVASATVSASAIVSSSTNILVTARNIGDVSFNGSSSIVPQRVFYKDTRSTEYNPFTYPGITLHLKTNTTDGLSNGGIFHGVLDLAHWLDSSGGVNHQLGLTDNGNMFIRNSTGSATWSSWSRFIKSTDNLTSLSVTTSSELASIISDETGTGKLVFNTNPVFEGNVTSSGSTGIVLVGTDGGGSISMGRKDSVASTPYIDFNSSSALSDFDVRLMVSDGSGSAGNGTMSVYGGMTVTKNFQVNGSLSVAGTITGTSSSATLSSSATIATHANTASAINASLLTGTTLPAAIVSSSLTGVGTLANLTVTNTISGRAASATVATHAGTASSIAGSLVTGYVASANVATHAGTASSIAGSLVTGTVASATVSSSATIAGHSNTASSIAGSLVTGTVASATVATHAGTASSIAGSLVTGTVASATVSSSSNFSAFATTQTSGNSSTSIATTAFVSSMVRYNGATTPNTSSVAGYFVIAVNPGTSLNGAIMIPQGATGRTLNALVDRGINGAASAGYIRGYVENNAGAAIGVGNSVPLYYIAW